MKPLNVKVKAFLETLKQAEHDSSSAREKAVHILVDSLDSKRIVIVKDKEGLSDAASAISAARARLEDINSRLDITVKAGLSSESIH